jgi:regulator of protease activity HflC (stomatin/prohibitin superfamily)
MSMTLPTKELPKAPSFRRDFRFGAINFLIMVAFASLGGIIQSNLTVPPGMALPIDTTTFGVLAGLVMGGMLTLVPHWMKVIAMSVGYWLVIHYLYPGLNAWALYLGGYLGIFCASAVQIASQWEKAVVLRLGKFRSLKGPGYFTIFPLIDRVDKTIDHRVRVTDFKAETTLTRDTVPVNVDAIAFWLVWDAKMSVLEVADFELAVTLSAQTALRDAIGRHELSQLLSEREDLGQEIQKALDKKTDPWGITIQAIEIRDIIIPQSLEDAMSRQAQAERERQSRVILGTAETEIAEKFALASESYINNPVALHLRAMNMVFEGLKQKGSMVIVPSSAVETMGLGALGGLTALGTPKGGHVEEEVREETQE